MKIKIMVISMIVAFVASSQAMEICSGESNEQVIDLRYELLSDSIDVSYNSGWIGGEESAEVVILDNGTEIKRTTGEGEFVWSPTTAGKHILTYTTYIDGVAQEEVYTATVFKDWKYAVEDGKATIIETTQTSGDIVIPSEIDGYPVVGLGEALFDGCEGLTGVVIPDSVTYIGAGVFNGCSGIRSVSISPTCKIADFRSGLYQVKFNSSDDFTSSILDSASKSLVSGVLMGDAYDTESVTRTYTDPKYGGSYKWNSRYTTFGYAGYMYMVEGRTYVFGKYFDDSVLVRINGNEVLKNTDHTAFATGKYVPEKTGWHEIEVRVADGTGEKGPKGVASSGYWSGNLGVGWRDDGITDALPESGWNKMMDPGDGSLFRCFEEVQDLTMRGLFPDSYDKLTSVTLTGEVTEIPDGFFADCAALESFIIPDSVTKIGANAFAGCASLENVEISESVTDIGIGAFSGCAAMADDDGYLVIRGVLYGYFGDDNCVTVPDGVAVIDPKAFYGCDALTSVTMPLEILEGNAEQAPQVGKNNWIEGEGGVYQSNDINDSESTSMTLEVEGPLDFTFDWKVSSESSCDELKCYLNGSLISEISGTGNGWQTVNYSIPEGVHTLRWEYSKDGSVSYGDDCGWVRITELVSASVTMASLFPDSYTVITNVVLTGDGERIPLRAFAGCASLQNVVIPDGVTTIGVRAFEGCEALSKITIPDDVTTIGEYAFNGCLALTEIVIPDSVDKIGENVFKDCTNLKSITVRLAVEGAAENLPNDVPLTLILDNNDQRIPERLRNCVQKVIFSDGITRIADDFFLDCNNLETIDIPQSVIAIGSNVFSSCSSLNIVNQDGFKLYQGWCLGYEGADNSTLKVPEGVLGIAAEAFKGMTSLKSVTFPDSLRFIGADAFAGCTQLAEFTLPDNIVEIADGAFRDCTWVQSVKMPSNLVRIGSAAFANCAYLPNVVCADGLEEIGVGAFSNCWRMTSVSLPASLDSVGRDAFWNCKNLGGVTVPAHVQPLAEMFSAAYSTLSSIIIAEGETELCEGAFEGCAGVTKIDIPEAITNIPARAFKNCTNFDRLVLPSGLLAIGDEAFYGCSKIESLTLPKNLTSIGAGAFNGWALLDVVTIPDGVAFIGSGAFAGCTAVCQVRMPSNVATVSATFPDAYTKIVRVTIPNNSTAIIAGFLNGCTSITAFDIPLSVTEIGDNAFRGCKNLSGISLPDGLDKIGSYAFYGCTLINDLTIPFSVTSIGNNAFGSCAQIRSVVISGEAGTLSSLFPNAYQQIVSVTVLSGSEKLMNCIFAGCKSLKNVDIPTSVTEIGEGAFENCTALTSVGIPSGVTVLGKGAFRGCTTLSEITLPTGLSILEDEVFSLCSCLSTITVPESVVEIGSKVFNGCSSLHSVKFVGNAPLADVESYTGVSSSLITYVPYASTGWDGILTSMALPEFWPVGYENTIEWWNPIRFDVTFDWNYEGVEADILEQVVDTTYLLPDVDPTREGATFIGWWTAKADGARITPASRVMLTTPHTLYAHWRMNTYSVVFDANGGIGAMEPMDLTVNKPAVLTACGFTRFDSDFAGWAIEPEGEVLYRDCAEVSNLTFENDAVVTLYAVWAPRTWTEGDYLNQPGFTFTSEGDEPWVTDTEVSHDGIGSLRSGVIGASAEYPNRTYSTIKTTVVGEGTGSFWWKVHCEEMDSEYGDWFDYAVFTVDGVEFAKIAGDTDWTKVTYSVTGAGEHELIWTFTRDDYDLEGAEWLNAAWLDELVWSPKMVALKFDAGGATGDVPEVILRQEGDSVLLPGSGALVKGTDIFKGWSDGTTLYIPGSEYTFGSEDETLTAIWEEKVWTLAEAADADALVMTTGGIADWTIDATTGYTNTMSVKSGVVALGQESWIETKVNGSGKLTFRWNVMGGAFRNQPFAYAKVEVDGTEVATEYLTDDWEEVVLMIDGDNEHTIRWTYLRTSTRAADGDCAWIDAVSWKAFRIVNSSIVYENLRGATHTNPETYQEGSVIEFTNPSEVEGYTFAGWTPERITADMTGAQTIRANWTANNYTIAYNSNGGSGTMEPTLATYDSEAIVKNNEFIRDGYTFKGWALEEGSDVVYAPGQSVINLTAHLNGVITFYAVWERILIAVDEPVAAENLIYNGTEQVGVGAADGYTLSGVSAAVDAGEYTATATLADGYKWADGSMEDKTITWSIAKAANEWITEPKISFESWTEGETVGELTDGVAKFGAVVVTIAGEEFTVLPTAPGSYTIEYSVAETGNYSGLIKIVSSEINKYVPIISEIIYENLRGATHTNPETYQERSVVEFADPSEVEGYTFAGWTPERITADMTGAQTIRANWTANNYTIAYNSNGGSGTMEPTLTTYDSEVIVKENTFVRPGFTFKGWALDEDGDVVYAPGQSVINLTVQAGGIITLYAKWANSHNFVIDEDGVLTEVILGDDTCVVIPDGVTSIGDWAFEGCSSLTSVTMPDSVTSIGEGAFFGCSSLTCITIPESVTSIGDWAFEGCSSLTSVTMPDSVTSIGEGAFFGCSSLTCITIPESVTSIGDSAFYGCEGLADEQGFVIIRDVLYYYCGDNDVVTIPDGVTSIGDYAFSDCSSLTSVTIGKSVTSIGDYAFCGCSSLKNVTIPDSVTSIGVGAFSGCSSLMSVTIPDSVTSIGDGAFDSCSSLTSVTIPDSVTSIGVCAFYYCSSLTSVTIGNGVTSIGEEAFSYCYSLTSVTIPDSVTSIEGHAFYYCEDLASAKVPLALKDQVESGDVFKWCSDDLLVEYYCVATFDANGGESLDETKRYVTVDTAIGSLFAPTREGCEFLGWFTAEEGGEEVTSETIVAADMTLYAHWEKLNPIPVIDPDWGYVVTELGKNKNEVAIVFTNHTEKAMTWTVPVNLENVQFLVVGGGGGGGSAGAGGAGGGGGGGVVTGMLYRLQKDSIVSAVVGTGGAGGTRNSSGGLLVGSHGGNSKVLLEGAEAVTAYGGARAHKDIEYSGGSGSGSYGAGKAGMATKGAVASGAEELVYGVELFGNNGGGGYNNKLGGGGGGAYPGDAGKGGTATSSTAGRGGAGLVSDITGSKVTYGSGGGGSAAKAGALGGEGAGNGSSNKNAVANQGGGGGGADDYSSGGAGGSGIVVIRYTIPSYLLPEVFPEVSDDSEVAAALAGSADAKLAENITSAADYAAFREWALNLEGVTPEEVKASSNAWLMYALNTDKLIIAAPKEGDVVIDTFEIAATEGAFEFTVKIDGVAVGDNALEANLKKVFDIEGAETLANSGAGFSTDNVDVNAAAPENGNVKFTVTPKMENGEKPDSFFFRVKMK